MCSDATFLTDLSTKILIGKNNFTYRAIRELCWIGDCQVIQFWIRMC